MKSKQLIDQYEQTILSEKQAKETVFNTKIEVAKKTFEQTCRQHLAELADELNPSDIEYRLGSSGYKENTLAIFSLKVSFMTVEGVIEQTYRIAEDKWDKPRLDFGTLRIDKDHIFQGWVDFPAIDLELGQLFAVIARYVPARDARRAEEVASKRKYFLDFSNVWQEQRVIDHLNEAIEAFPDDAELFQQKALEAAERIQAKRRQEQEQDLARDLEQSEREQLIARARYSWSLPFDVFKVEYGAHVINDNEDDGDQLTITRTFYTNAEKPDADGYWKAYDNGQLTRRIKPANIMAIEIQNINGHDSCPRELRRQITLQSKVLTDVSYWADLPPVEYFVFDYDAIKIAVEAEQPKDDQAED